MTRNFLHNPFMDCGDFFASAPSLSSRGTTGSRGILALSGHCRSNRCVDPSTRKLAQDDTDFSPHSLHGLWRFFVPAPSLSSRGTAGSRGIFALPGHFRSNRCVDPSTRRLAQDDTHFSPHSLHGLWRLFCSRTVPVIPRDRRESRDPGTAGTFQV